VRPDAWPPSGGAASGSQLPDIGCAGALRYVGPELGVLPRLVLGGGTMLAVYLVMLLFVLGQRAFYWDLLRGLRRSAGRDSLSAESLSNTGRVS
jgi:hypothetical protein